MIAFYSNTRFDFCVLYFMHRHYRYLHIYWEAKKPDKTGDRNRDGEMVEMIIEIL